MKSHTLKSGILTLIVLLLSISACDKNGFTPDAKYINVQDEILAEPLAGRLEFELRASQPWKAETDDAWIKLLKTKGQAKLKELIAFEVLDNAELEERAGKITITLLDNSKKEVIVKQEGRGKFITLPQDILYFNNRKADYEIKVKTLVEWTVDKTSENGFTFTPVDKNTLRISASSDMNIPERQSVVTLTSKVNPEYKASLTVVQKNVKSIIQFSTTQENKAQFMGKNAGEFTMPVAADSKYRIIVSDDWIQASALSEIDPSNPTVQNSELKIMLSNNNTFFERQGTIRIENMEDSQYADVLEVTQSGASKVIYVKPGGTGDGSSWEMALGSVEDAMKKCAQNSDEEIWVAEGEYQLKDVLAKKAYNVYGGFTGNEKAVHQRDRTKKSVLISAPLKKGMVANGVLKDNPRYFFMDGFVFKGTNNKNEGDVSNIQVWFHQVLTNCIICDNWYGKNTGGYFDNTYVYNCVFYNNKTENASPIQLYNSTMINCTIVENIANTTWCSASGLRLSETSNVYNTVIWNNKHAKATGLQMYIDKDNLCSMYNCASSDGEVFNHSGSTKGLLKISDNFMKLDKNVNPGFVNPEGRDYSLVSNSVLVNSGTNAVFSAYTIPFDIFGRPRISDGTVDLGAFEFQK